VFGKGIFRLVPIISGVLVGFAMSFAFGVVDTAKIAAARGSPCRTSPRRSSTGRRSCSSFRWPWRRPSSTLAG
jgi:uracil permease